MAKCEKQCYSALPQIAGAVHMFPSFHPEIRITIPEISFQSDRIMFTSNCLSFSDVSVTLACSHNYKRGEHIHVA